jgi:hypothetical protein
MKKAYVVIDSKEEACLKISYYIIHIIKNELFAMCESSAHPQLYRCSVSLDVCMRLDCYFRTWHVLVH